MQNVKKKMNKMLKRKEAENLLLPLIAQGKDISPG